MVELRELHALWLGRPETSQDRFGPFHKRIGYEGYQKSLYAQDWFDSSTEREAANILEDEENITLWVRLQIGDLPILWTEAREYTNLARGLATPACTGTGRKTTWGGPVWARDAREP